MALRNFNSFSC